MGYPCSHEPLYSHLSLTVDTLVAQYVSPALSRGRLPCAPVNGAGGMSDGDTWVVALSLSFIIVLAVAVASRSIAKELHRSR